MIKRIKIKNFRSLDIDVSLAPVTVFVGRSGTGKSNFIDAMRYLRNRLSNKSQVADTNIKPITTKKGNPFLEYEMTFNISQIKGDFNYYIKFDFRSISNNNLSVQEERLALDDNVLFHVENSKWVKEPSIPGQHPQGICLASIKGVQEISVAYIALSRGMGCYDFPGDICRQPKPNPHNFNKTENFSNGLWDQGQNVNAVFSELRNDLTRFKSWNRINDLMRFLNSSIETIDQQSGDKDDILVTHRFGNSSIVLDLARESEGCRRFFAYLLAFYQTPPKLTMFFEEPEKGLYPAAFAALANEMKLCPENGQGQIILTTHSPELLNSFPPESLRVVVMENGVTKIGPIASDQLESLQEHLIFPGELLTVDDARIDEQLVLSGVGEE